MPTAENAKLYYEAGQLLNAMAALTDSGDHLFYKSGDSMWSNKSGYEPKVYPDGLATGGAVTPGVSGSNDKIDVAGLTCYLAGVLTTVAAAADQTVSRGADADVCRINSVQVTAAGAIDIIEGVDAAAFSETRGANGGPPAIVVGSIEIAQVRLGAVAAGVVTADEIFQVVGTHQERYDYPAYAIKYANVEGGLLGYAGIEFTAVQPLSHTGGVTRKVYAKWYEPQFAEVTRVADFVPPETSHSVSSTQIYGGVLGSHSKSLGQGSFTAYLNDGISDGFLLNKDECLWFKFFQDGSKDPYVLCQGYLGISRSFPAGNMISAKCTISAEEAAVEVIT